MAASTIYSRFLKRLTATAAFGLLTATSQAGLFCDWHVDHKRPYCSPACEPDWGYNETCWRKFPPTKPCTDWGAHCSSCSAGGDYGSTGNYDANYDANMGPVPMMGAIQQAPSGYAMQPQPAPMMQQPLLIQPPQTYGAPVNNMMPQNGYNANPALIPPMGGPQQHLGQQQSTVPRTFGPQPQNQLPQSQLPQSQLPQSQQANPSGNSQQQDGGQLQLPGLDADGMDFGNGKMELPKLPDLSYARPYNNSQFNVQGATNAYHRVSQANVPNGYPNQPAYPQPTYPQPNAAGRDSANGMMSQGVPGPSQYGQPTQSQQAYPQPMGQQPMSQQPMGQQPISIQPMGQQPISMPTYPQAGNQLQAPQPGRYMRQPTSIQVVPGRQPSVVGVSFTKSIRPANNRSASIRPAINRTRSVRPMSVRPMSVQKKSFLSKINPFSK